ncbi:MULTISPECIES: hypothetical protein [Streptomyces]|uniref:effector-associated constant component EACC1 n=1 Tax=Streptomyces TaxID=1883 RepID=UPI0004C29158|nr:MULTISPECIES: hypothetical protein [unclassified Streptomyces]KOU04715.1 hypothetical protein ADK88_21060 [Streptomyces sp. NRRL F-2295]KOU49073.1 hypothetical protein ADK56_19935 [Streptomyces sp. MMG1522]MBD3547993.1 hypothetical protein [Streptomyces sp. JV180]MBD3553860.1 hypothetical protein [Streptomyces sp. SP18CM02]
MAVQVGLKFEDLDMPEEELRSLHNWLMSDPAARRHARPSLASSQELPPGAQGDVIDIISLVLGNGFAAASLMMSLASWRASRSQTSRITIELPDGRSIVISQNSTDTTALLDSLTDETENRDDSPS